MQVANENPEKTSKNQEDGDKLCIFLCKPLFLVSADKSAIPFLLVGFLRKPFVKFPIRIFLSADKSAIPYQSKILIGFSYPSFIKTIIARFPSTNFPINNNESIVF